MKRTLQVTGIIVILALGALLGGCAAESGGDAGANASLGGEKVSEETKGRLQAADDSAAGGGGASDSASAATPPPPDGN